MQSPFCFSGGPLGGEVPFRPANSGSLEPGVQGIAPLCLWIRCRVAAPHPVEPEGLHRENQEVTGHT
eukprot:5530656-Alexandrium_andersonii.AAC.1